MFQEYRHKAVSISLIVAFIVLSLFATFRPSVGGGIIQYLVLPALFLSIVATAHAILENVVSMCSKSHGYFAQEHKKFDEWRTYCNSIDPEKNPGDEKYGTYLLQLDAKMGKYEKAIPKIAKYSRVIYVTEIVALVLLLLSAFLRPSFIRVIDESAVAYWALTFMLLSTFFSQTVADYIVKNRIEC